MPVDPGLLALIQDDLAGLPDLREQRMFGGLAFMLHGHMLAGLMPHALFYRIGREQEAKALALPGVAVMQMARRAMAGFVTLGADDAGGDETRARLLALALAHHATLPAR